MNSIGCVKLPPCNNQKMVLGHQMTDKKEQKETNQCKLFFACNITTNICSNGQNWWDPQKNICIRALRGSSTSTTIPAFDLGFALDLFIHKMTSNKKRRSRNKLNLAISSPWNVRFYLVKTQCKLFFKSQCVIFVTIQFLESCILLYVYNLQIEVTIS